MKSLRYLLITGAALLPASGFAADLMPPPEPASEWTFKIAPYLWMATLEGDIGQFGLPDIEINAPFKDILKNLDFGAMAVAEAHNGTFGVLSDIMYVKLGADDGASIRNLDVDIDVTSETFTGLLAGEFRLIDAEGGSLDVLAGARLWSVSTDVDITGDLDRSASDSATWVDPTIGLKSRVDLSPDFFFNAWGMIGGFGISSDFAWDAYGGIGYQISESTALVAGYRAISVDYEKDDFKFDVIEHGPVLGAVFTF